MAAPLFGYNEVCRHCEKTKEDYEHRDVTWQATDYWRYQNEPPYKVSYAMASYQVPGEYVPHNAQKQSDPLCITNVFNPALSAWNQCCDNFRDSDCDEMEADCPCGSHPHAQAEFGAKWAGTATCATCLSWINQYCNCKPTCGLPPLESDLCPPVYPWYPGTATCVWKITMTQTPAGLPKDPVPPKVDDYVNKDYTPSTYGDVTPQCAYTGLLDCANVQLPAPTKKDDPIGEKDQQETVTIPGNYTFVRIDEMDASSTPTPWIAFSPNDENTEGFKAVNNPPGTSFTVKYDWTGILHSEIAHVLDVDCHYCT